MSDHRDHPDGDNGGTQGGVCAPGSGAAPDAADVLRLVDFDRGNAFRVVSELRGVWQGLRRADAIPARAQIEPQHLHRVLSHAFILERIAPGAARFRLAGRHLIDLMGMEVRGMPLCALVLPASRGRLSDVLETVFKAPQIAELGLAAPADYARPALTGRMLLLPLRSDLGDVTRALGCVVAEGEIGVAPRRFALTDEVLSPVIAGGAVMAPTPAAPGFAEPLHGFAGRPPLAGRPARAAPGPDSRAAAPSPQPADPPAHSAPAAPQDPSAVTPEARRQRFRLITRDD